ncbi:hypothetical protein [Maribacter arenosus]|uniref:Uncharacterized protein n=1 Tax=Maribacter arenosus TaxID=1854708 RepID=A0ABR7V992_9FLAO|nr:hypothetical protein [Maribacter arenosus]MBD0849132.1 hypothetical protein [Maribacter arenosus]
MVPKDYDQFLETLENAIPDNDWPTGLKALWYDAVGDWEASHNIAQEMHTELGSWIHAYLHRKEGDEWNAGYWYRKANKSIPKVSLDEEFQLLAKHLLEKDSPKQ